MFEAAVPLVVGVVLIALSRWIADNFKVRGEYGGATGAMLRFGGLYDNYASQLYRWCVCVLTGLVFIGVGVAEILS